VIIRLGPVDREVVEEKRRGEEGFGGERGIYRILGTLPRIG